MLVLMHSLVFLIIPTLAPGYTIRERRGPILWDATPISPPPPFNQFCRPGRFTTLRTVIPLYCTSGVVSVNPIPCILMHRSVVILTRRSPLLEQQFIVFLAAQLGCASPGTLRTTRNYHDQAMLEPDRG